MMESGFSFDLGPRRFYLLCNQICLSARSQSIQAATLCKDNKTDACHSSHIMQSLDVGIFKTIKTEWWKAVKRQNKAEILTKSNLPVFLKKRPGNYACQKIYRNNMLIIQGGSKVARPSKITFNNKFFFNLISAVLDTPELW